MSHYHTWPFGMGVSDGLLFILLKFLFIGVILGLIIFILKLILGPSLKNNIQLDPIEILKTRLAKGEISEEEYKRLRSLINKEK